MKIRPGDIIVSAAGEVLLRKVTSVNTVGTNIEVNTEFASLVDAIEQGDLELDQPLYTSQIKSIEYHVPGLKCKNETTKGNAWYRQINYNGLRIERNSFDKRDGFSVRCLKD